MAPRPRYWQVLQSAKEEAMLAVDLYNRPLGHRYLEAHIVHMHMAWLYLGHGVFIRDGVDFRYWQPDGRHLKRTKDGDPMTWDLARSIVELYPDENNPVRRNLEFFIPLRNMVEHRHARVIEAVVAGRIQSNVLNFEQKVVSEFGSKEGLGQVLRLPIFLSSLTEDAAEAVKRAYDLLPVRIRNFISDYEEGLPEDVRNHPHYDLRIYLVPKTGPKTQADAALEFVRTGDLTPEQREALQQVQVIIRDRIVPMANQGLHKPSAVANAVQEAIPWRFDASNTHAKAWRHFGVRPDAGAANAAGTDQRYCVYDQPHQDYLYTDAWIAKLKRELQTEEDFRTVTGRRPSPKE